MLERIDYETDSDDEDIIREKPELFNDKEKIVLRYGQIIKTVIIPITPCGSYNGNGEYQDPEDQLFKIIGFERSEAENTWIGRAYIICENKFGM